MSTQRQRLMGAMTREKGRLMTGEVRYNVIFTTQEWGSRADTALQI